MSRTARIVVPGCPHHLVQRGNRRQRTFFGDADYRTYLHIAAEEFCRAEVDVWAYCLMPNHVHLIATPKTEAGLAAAMGDTHRRYTKLINEREGWRGFLWQGRFASFAMDDRHLLNCFRYVGLNPVRAGLVDKADQWPWSSVRGHLLGGEHRLLKRDAMIDRLGEDLADWFGEDVSEGTLADLRKSTATGRPLGAEEWIKALEERFGQAVRSRPRGRPPINRDTYQFPPA